ncbi:PilL N-terminal domain-containing protein [Achromobacter xylosoxidans]
MRQGRYTLVELTPEADQRDLLSQVVETSIPLSAVQPTVGDALEHVLLRSGYRLCPHTGEFAALLPLHLPAAHLHLGPMTLRDALGTLAGSAWRLAEDASRREVCFEQATPTVTPTAPTTAPATSLPVPPAEPLRVSTRHP